MYYFKRFSFYCLSLFFFVLAGCGAKKESSLVTQDKQIGREKAIVVIGIQWIEEYNNAKLTKIESKQSQELLLDTEKIEQERKYAGKPGLRNPLYYLANFQMSSERNAAPWLARYNKDLREYETLALHEVTPGTQEIKHLQMDQYRFFQKGGNEPVRWKQFTEKYPLPAKTWNLSAGKVFYLGHVTFYFKTKRTLFGIFPREQVVKKIELTRVRWQNQFEEAQQTLGKEKPWFPSTNIENLGWEGDWSWKNQEWVPYYAEKQEEKKEKEKKEKEKKEKEKKEKVDLDKYFY